MQNCWLELEEFKKQYPVGTVVDVQFIGDGTIVDHRVATMQGLGHYVYVFAKVEVTSKGKPSTYTWMTENDLKWSVSVP